MKGMLTAFVTLSVTTAAMAQDHAMHAMPEMAMPAAGPIDAPSHNHIQPTGAIRLPTRDRPDMDHAAGHGAGGPASPNSDVGERPEGTDLPAGASPAPPPPLPHYADRIWGASAMARGRHVMMRRDGGDRQFSQIMVNLAEVQVRRGRDGYRWDAEGWFGGDIHRIVVKTEGEGEFGSRPDAAEVQGLYSRAVGPYFNLQGGVRHDVAPRAAPTFATIAVDGLAPYWFDIEVAAFLSEKGELLGRIEASYDQRITQRLVLQPRVELNLAARRVDRLAMEDGIASTELGLRLRYEIKREIAPYLGVSWERRRGGFGTAMRQPPRDAGGIALAIGIRGWL